MPTLADYFTDDQIISHLCKERLKVADSINEWQYPRRLIGNLPETPLGGTLYQILPSRAQWPPSRPRHRSSSVNPDLQALEALVQRSRSQSSPRPWVNELNRFIAGIQARVLGSQLFELRPPNINWQLKKDHEYRALCRFTLEDNLILCLFARYLRDAFDSQFSSSSYAFRAARSGRVPTHHDAFNGIYNLKHNTPAHDLYVAECDIRGFFDAVDHGVALSAYCAAARAAHLGNRSDQIFQAYLDCYSFPSNVLTETLPRLRQRDMEGTFPWPLQPLQQYHSNPMAERIGVPQGGAVSGIIANLILDAADKRVERERQRLGAEIYYYRFCDDMILLSPVKQHCRIVFNAYRAALHDLRLPYHEPERTFLYGKNHWMHKSKAPYRWSGQPWFGRVPWVQFVGYQIRYDGLVRPKKDSVNKEVKKLHKKAAQLKYRLLQASRQHPILATKDQAVASLKHKLVAQGVGRIKGGERPGPKPMSWAAGFKTLHNKPLVSGSLRLLDRMRRKQIGKFVGAYIQYGDGRTRRGGRGRNPVGYAFSYHAQFTNLGGPNLIQNPWRPQTVKQWIQYYSFRACQKFRAAAFAISNNAAIIYSICPYYMERRMELPKKYRIRVNRR